MINLKERTDNLSCPVGETPLAARGNNELTPVIISHNWLAEVGRKWHYLVQKEAWRNYREYLLEGCRDYRLVPVIISHNWLAEVGQQVADDLVHPQEPIGQSFTSALKEFRLGPVIIPRGLLATVAKRAIIHTFEHEEGPDINQPIVDNIYAILSRQPSLTQEEILRARGRTRQLFETVGRNLLLHAGPDPLAQPAIQEEILRARAEIRQLFETVGRKSLLWHAGPDPLAQPAEILVNEEQATKQILAREKAWNTLQYILFGKPENTIPEARFRGLRVWQEAIGWRKTIMANLPLFYRLSLDSLEVQRMVDITTCLETGEKAPEVLAETAKTIGFLLGNYFRDQKKEQGLVFETNVRVGLARNLFGRNAWATANFSEKSPEPYKPEITYQQAEKLADCLVSLSWREIPEVSEEAVREAGKLITIAQQLLGKETVKKGVFLPRLMGALGEAARFYKIDQIEDSVVQRRPIEDYAKAVVSPFLALGGDFACKSEFDQEGTYRLQVEGLKRTSAPGIFHNYLTRIATRIGLSFPMSAKIDLALIAEGQTVSLKVATKEFLKAYYQGSKAVTALVSPKCTWGLKDEQS